MSEKLRPMLYYVTRGYELEALGRKIASEDWKRIGAEDMGFFKELYLWHTNFYDELDRLGLIVSADVHSSFERILFSCYRIYHIFSEYIYGGDFERSARLRDITYVYKSLIKELLHYNANQYGLSGEDGIWIYGKLMDDDSYTYSAFVNDYTSSFHRLLNWVNRNYGSVVRVNHRVFAFPNASEDAVKLCMAWGDAVEKYNEFGIYDGGDFSELRCVVVSNSADIRVGSSPGHATHVEIMAHGITATYYDTDEIVNRVISRLAESYGIRIERMDPRQYVAMFIPHDKAAAFAQAVLPFATSMDLRLALPSEWWESLIEEASKHFDAHRLMWENREEFERLMCMYLYSKVYGK